MNEKAEVSLKDTHKAKRNPDLSILTSSPHAPSINHCNKQYILQRKS